MKRVVSVLPSSESPPERFRVTKAELRKIVKCGGIEMTYPRNDSWALRLRAIVESYAHERTRHKLMPKAHEVRDHLLQVKAGLDGIMPPIARVVGNFALDTISTDGMVVERGNETKWPEATRQAIGHMLYDPDGDDVAPIELFVQLGRMQKRAATWLARLSAKDGGREGDPYFEELLIPKLHELWLLAGGTGELAQNKGGIYSGAFLDMICATMDALTARSPSDFPEKKRGTVYQAIRRYMKLLSQNQQK